MMKIIILLLALVPFFSFSSTRITVSGISSGAYMAQQFHTAFSSSVGGAGMIAGGPYYCAKASVVNALNRCMKSTLGLPLVKDSLFEAKNLFQNNLIDDPANIATSRVYILSGTNDNVVFQEVADVGVKVYEAWGVKGNSLIYENKLPVGHAFPTDNFGNTCATQARSPFISNCKRDVAGEMLSHLLGNLQPPKSPKGRRYFSYNQAVYVADADTDKVSMNNVGYAYIPEGCDYPEAGGCNIHVAFHGCKQTLEDIKTDFVTKTGYNHWAEANKIVVVYPQASKESLFNPNGCWDWWGYTGSNYHTKRGPQMKAVMSIVEALQRGALQLKQIEL
jgi:Esterase PHB depolymerase